MIWFSSFVPLLHHIMQGSYKVFKVKLNAQFELLCFHDFNLVFNLHNCKKIEFK